MSWVGQLPGERDGLPQGMSEHTVGHAAGIERSKDQVDE